MNNKKETAPEVPVQEQPKLDSIIKNQVQILQLAQERCLESGSFETVVLISRTLIDITTLFLNHFH